MDSVKTDAKWKLVPVEPTPEMIEAGDVANPTAWNEDTDLGFGCDVAFEVYRAMLAASPPAGAEVRVKPLVWEEITQARSDEDPTREPSGDYEAVTPVGTYYIEMYFGTNSYGWDVSFNGDHVADRDDPDDAKAAAQADYERRILSALEPTPSTDAVRRQAREWQPIETAPSDGEPIWVAGGGWECPTITPADGDWWRHEARNGSKVVPRWWMPVICPTLPAGADEGGADEP